MGAGQEGIERNHTALGKAAQNDAFRGNAPLLFSLYQGQGQGFGACNFFCRVLKAFRVQVIPGAEGHAAGGA